MSNTVRPLNFGVERTSGEATRYGQYYWMVGLPDGREMSFNADRIEVSGCGSLIAWRNASENRGEQILLTLASGAWSHCYAASCLDGSPVCGEYLSPPVSNTKRKPRLVPEVAS